MKLRDKAQQSQNHLLLLIKSQFTCLSLWRVPQIIVKYASFCKVFQNVFFMNSCWYAPILVKKRTICICGVFVFLCLQISVFGNLTESPGTRVDMFFPFLFFFTCTVRGFIKHQRLENSPSATHNSPAKFQWSMATFYSDESDVDIIIIPRNG